MESFELSLLATLDALLQEGSVTGAARRVGLSVPAVSHALGRIRDRLGDPILVRAGRSMVLTPRAEALRPRVRDLVAEARLVLSAERPFSPGTLRRRFTLRVTDHVLTILGVALDRLVTAQAPGVELRYLPNGSDDASQLREGLIDLAIGIYGELPPELRTRPLFTDRFVCVVRQAHPQVGKRLTLEQFLALGHVQVAPRGKPGGYLDDVLAERGLERRIVHAIPYFLAALHLVSRTDYVATLSERLARVLAEPLGLKLLPPPLTLEPYALSLVWHPRVDADPAHRWLREVLLRAAAEAAGDAHANPRTRLDGKPRRRARR